MDKKLRAGVLGGTGMVGQRFITLLENHPWFQVTAIGASERSAGRSYEQAVEGRWKLDVPIPENVKNITVLNAADINRISDEADFVFCAVDMKRMKSETSKRNMHGRNCLLYPTTLPTDLQRTFR